MYKKRIYVDYSKWLGPNQKVRYEGAGINICNHTCSIFDIAAMLALIPQMSGFISKSEFTAPGMTQLAPAIGMLFLSRDTKIVGERKNLIEAIRARQILAEEGKQNPLTIMPEGGTTNGEYIIKFKKGAFATLRAVKPYYVS